MSLTAAVLEPDSRVEEGTAGRPIKTRVSKDAANVLVTVSAKEVGPFGALPPEVRERLRWSRPCEAAFRFLAQNAPAGLLLLIERGEMAPSDLTFAAEIAGSMEWTDALGQLLFSLLRHGSPVVREGAVLGLSGHLDRAEVRTAVEAVRRSDPISAVREAAASVLDE